MNNKINIESLKEFIPDYITGDISEENRKELESALVSSEELTEFFNEMKSTMDFVQNIKQDEPSPAYWNSLLPRIHQKLEANENKGFSWEKILSFWKVLAPVAAVVLIAVIYFAIKQPAPEITKDEQKKENLQNDSSIKDSKKQELKSENKSSETEQKTNVKENEEKSGQKYIYKEKRNLTPLNEDQKEIVKDNNEISPNDNNSNSTPNTENVAGIEIEDLSIFATGEGAGLDEDTENELKRLSDNEKDNLIEELINSNL